MTVGEAVWTGSWVAERLGVHVEGDGVAELVGLALRHNPRRAHLLVSRVLGKHVPTDPRLVRAAGLALGARVAQVLDGQQRPRVSLQAALDDRPGAAAAVRDELVGSAGVSGGSVPAGSSRSGVTVLGYAETATGLGHLVAEALDAEVYLHSTRRSVAGMSGTGGFAEEHSHACEHLLLPADPGMLTGGGPLVLVDDELSTGRTVANTLRALHRLSARPHYVVATLADLRAPADHAGLQALAVELGARVDVVALAAGVVQLPPDVLAAGAALVAEHSPGASSREAVPSVPPRATKGSSREPVPVGPVRVDLGWPAGLPDGGRHGVLRQHRTRLEAELPAMAARLAQVLPADGEVLVLGFEELMHAPLRLAEALADDQPGLVVRSSTTTRSPVLAVDADGYAIRHRLVFTSHDDPTDGPGERYAYNIAPGRFAAVALVVDRPGDTPELAGLLGALAAVTPSVVLAVLPSYLPGGSS